MAELAVVVAVKPVAPVLEVDWLAGTVRTDPRHCVRTAADAAACAVGAAIAAACATTYAVVSVAGPSADGVLRDALAEGAARAVRVALGGDADEQGPAVQWGSDVVAGALAELVGDATVVVCGDASGDRGSGTVPGLLAGRLGVAQALALRRAAWRGGRLEGERRLDGGRRERVAVAPPCVVSVEAGAGVPVRAPLAAAIAASSDARAVEVVTARAPAGARRGDHPGARVGPYRPRPSELAAPVQSDPVLRAIEVAGTMVRSDPPELLRCDPDEAAAAILERLERWGMR